MPIKHLLTANEIEQIEQALVALDNVSQTTDTNAIEKQIESVNAATANFAELRMDSSIRTALAGHSVDEV